MASIAMIGGSAGTSTRSCARYEVHCFTVLVLSDSMWGPLSAVTDQNALLVMRLAHHRSLTPHTLHFLDMTPTLSCVRHMPQDIEGVRKVQDYGWATWLLTFHNPYY